MLDVYNPDEDDELNRLYAEQLATPEQTSTSTPQFVAPLPDVPSPQPVRPQPSPYEITPEQQSDMNSRSSALNLLQAGSLGIGQIANIMKPGASDPGSTMALFKQYQAQVGQPKADAELVRKQGVERQKTADMQALRNEQAQSAQLKNTQFKAEHDPGSKESLSAADDFAQHYRTMAESKAWTPGLSAMFKQAADNARGKTFAELTLMDNRLGKTIGQENQADLARGNQAYREAMLKATQDKNAADAADKKADNERADNKEFDATIRKPQEKLNQDINGLRTAIGGMKEIMQIKTGGNDGKGINTGFLMDFASKIGEKFDLTSNDRNNMNALVARVFNKETKQLAGSAVSDAEWSRISPQIPQTKDDDNVFVAKLQRAIMETERILEARKQEYQTKGGKPVDASNVARANAKPEGAPVPDAAPVPLDAAQVDRAKKAAAGGNQKARQWLIDNGVK